jgi:23S rRNA pseudouridine2605 synthase
LIVPPQKKQKPAGKDRWVKKETTSSASAKPSPYKKSASRPAPKRAYKSADAREAAEEKREHRPGERGRWTQKDSEPAAARSGPYKKSARPGGSSRPVRKNAFKLVDKESALKKKDNAPVEKERLQKILAHAGIASRRASEALILAGRVRVNGEVVTELGLRIDPGRDEITVDSRAVPRQAEGERHTYIMLHKPRNVLSTVADDRQRDTVLNLVDVKERVYPVGRLDFHSEGLLLLTNDGDLTRKLTHPSQHVEKEYQVLVTGKPSTAALFRWREGGIELEGKPLKRAIVEKMSEEGDNTWLRVVLTEGRKRQIREVADILGHPVLVLRRVRVGPIKLGNLKPGKWRFLTPSEVDRLKNDAPRKSRS